MEATTRRRKAEEVEAKGGTNKGRDEGTTQGEANGQSHGGKKGHTNEETNGVEMHTQLTFQTPFPTFMFFLASLWLCDTGASIYGYVFSSTV
ncbi:hypothetical protein ElyMa_006748000 [Elysia marginata]|uniref:Uncharacterized protein n=1 Tax=Elysia marginata TaxID=1093978 RepID=A0AAV4IWM0_9GAST|nr:hypothetical protein ElyMa_006748000 [Elysia marginata]